MSGPGGGHTAAISKKEIWKDLSQSSGTNREVLTLLVTSVTFQQVVLTPVLAAAVVLSTLRYMSKCRKSTKSSAL